MELITITTKEDFDFVYSIYKHNLFHYGQDHMGEILYVGINSETVSTNNYW